MRSRGRDTTEMAIMAALVLTDEGGSGGQEIDLAEDDITIGRSSECRLVIDAPSISGRHCRVTNSPRGYLVRDLGSTNGTFINDRRVVAAQIRPGDILRLGDVTLRFKDETAAVEPPANVFAARRSHGMKNALIGVILALAALAAAALFIMRLNGR